jgi:hypothetical protein
LQSPHYLTLLYLEQIFLFQGSKQVITPSWILGSLFIPLLTSLFSFLLWFL